MFLRVRHRRLAIHATTFIATAVAAIQKPSLQIVVNVTCHQLVTIEERVHCRPFSQSLPLSHIIPSVHQSNQLQQVGSETTAISATNNLSKVAARSVLIQIMSLRGSCTLIISLRPFSKETYIRRLLLRQTSQRRPLQVYSHSTNRPRRRRAIPVQILPLLVSLVMLNANELVT